MKRFLLPVLLFALMATGCENKQQQNNRPPQPVSPQPARPPQVGGQVSPLSNLPGNGSIVEARMVGTSTFFVLINVDSPHAPSQGVAGALFTANVGEPVWVEHGADRLPSGNWRYTFRFPASQLARMTNDDFGRVRSQGPAAMQTWVRDKTRAMYFRLVQL